VAFSGGGDSTALFFLLLEQNIPFDIAHVNYQTREQSNAKSLQPRIIKSFLALHVNLKILILSTMPEKSVTHFLNVSFKNMATLPF
jgi:7-cyano-7-deazaguanine synthase in queuosine biosynthesis